MTVFTTLVLLMSGVTAAIPYFVLGARTDLVPDDRGQSQRPTRAAFAKEMTIAIVALLFSIWFVF